MNIRQCKIAVLFVALTAACVLFPSQGSAADGPQSTLDAKLSAVLTHFGFTGRIGSTLEQRLGRPVDRGLADLGRKLFHDTIVGLNNDNSCSGCHSATAGFGDTQSIAIGIENNNIVGPHRVGPRNQRRTPMLLNVAFFPTLMWNSRFASLSGDPFDNSAGFQFPPPEGLSLSSERHLLAAQAFIPPTERNEAAGFDFEGTSVDIRAEVMRRINEVSRYRDLFGRFYPEVRDGGPITYQMFARAIAEFEFMLVFTDAPIDRYARGELGALTLDQKRGAMIFFARAGCVTCHAVSGESNEMFSDFKQHVAGIPQVFPAVTNSVFDGPGGNEDFGLEQVTGNPNDRYAFRTSPLRNVALQPTFFHNGSFTRLEDAIRYHVDAVAGARTYSPTAAGLDLDLCGPTGPAETVLARIDSLLGTPVSLTDTEFRQLVDFVRTGLLDPRARPENLRRAIPDSVPSGRPVHVFE
jgi:cytochrome c peroxidase